MAEFYKSYGIEYIDYRGDYRVYDPWGNVGTIAYVDSIEEAKKGIDEQLPERKIIYDKGNFRAPDAFLVVDKIPSGFHIWNIGNNMADGYLPICQGKAGEYEWQACVDLEHLYAIDMTDRPELLAALRKAAGIGITDIIAANKYLHVEPKDDLAKQQLEYSKKLLPVFEELSEQSYTPEPEPNDEPEI